MLTEKQKENRKKGIGASECGIVMGLNKFISPYQLWMIKTGRMEADDISQLPHVYWGTVHEEQIAQEYAKQMNCKVRRVTNTLFHKDHPYMLCHLDRKIEGKSKVLECKFSMYASDDWGPNGSDIVPLTYILQVQHQLAVTGYEEADLAVLIGGWDFRVYHFKREESIIKKIMEEISYFWECVETDTAPALRDRNDVYLVHPYSTSGYKEADANVLSTVMRIKQLKSELKGLETEKEKLENNLTLFIQESEGVKCDQQVIATWKSTKAGNRVLRIKE